MPKFQIGDIVTVNKNYHNQFVHSEEFVVKLLVATNNPFFQSQDFTYDLEARKLRLGIPAVLNDVAEDCLDMVMPISASITSIMIGAISNAPSRAGSAPIVFTSPTHLVPALKVGDIVEYINPDSIVLKYGTLFEIVAVCDDSLTVHGKNLGDGKEYSFLRDSVKIFSSKTDEKKEKLHFHFWKNYKGLSYQEEFCDGCGATKDKRPLYS